MKISLFDVGYEYSKDTPFSSRALEHVDMVFKEGRFYAIIGHTGSGKSTIIQHLNALLQPTEGHLDILGTLVTERTKKKELREIRKRVGVVFQFAEQQLFEETVLKDIIFGPMNFGIPQSEAEARARQFMQQLGLDESLLERSPFELSGGQMRRVAIIGVLAAEPDFIVLDEPTAGLDPKGQKELMAFFKDLQQKTNQTIILVTHQMEQAAVTDEIYVMHKGTNVYHGTPQQVFSKDLSKYGIYPPKIVELQRRIEQKHGFQFDELAMTPEAFKEMYMDWGTLYVR